MTGAAVCTVTSDGSRSVGIEGGGERARCARAAAGAAPVHRRAVSVRMRIENLGGMRNLRVEAAR
ncbi:hypothetical protein LF63_0103720 [Oleiagrimonas soli]|uniref:Uncharacterized protein n=1 Tax=Oleiagrimonas soli TaxID=1543381 RepID=A0A099CYB2_9GAMM|nr:hypothetical protein LF63_0103720 [Oleiagrimonas soli]